jgi:hypothetical protein
MKNNKFHECKGTRTRVKIEYPEHVKLHYLEFTCMKCNHYLYSGESAIIKQLIEKNKEKERSA